MTEDQLLALAQRGDQCALKSLDRYQQTGAMSELSVRDVQLSVNPYEPRRAGDGGTQRQHRLIWWVQISRCLGRHARSHELYRRCDDRRSDRSILSGPTSELPNAEK